jgi:hypothetical protein
MESIEVEEGEGVVEQIGDDNKFVAVDKDIKDS